MKTMHEHDTELITAVAEGRLTGPDLLAAQAEIATCEFCRARLDEQTIALRFLRGATAVTLSEEERASLHRVIHQAAPVRRSRLVRLAPAFGAAAALALAVGIAATLGRGAGTSLETSQADSSLESRNELRTAAPEGLTTTTAAAAATTTPASFMGATDDAGLAAFAEHLRTTPPQSPSVYSGTVCDAEATKQSSQAAVAISDFLLDGTPAVIYVYPDVALVFDQETCALLQTVPADGP
jgi:hypothetical protein